MTVGEERSKLYTSGYSHQNNTMLAQQRLPRVHLEYLQPHITTSETKASPLALLAATCSSIGKTDSDRKDPKTTASILNKLSMHEEDSKSSFKPYKFDEKPFLRNSPPTLTSNPSIMTLQSSAAVTSSLFQNRLQTTMSVSESERGRCAAELLSREHKEHYPMLLKCHTRSPPLPHLPRTMLSPHHHNHHEHGECVQCKPMRPHSDPLPMRNPLTQGGPPCPCASCNQSRADPKCHFPPAGITSLYPPYKNQHLQPMITCRDPACTNCSKVPPPHSSVPPPHSNVQNFLHPALIHQCTHGTSHKTSYPPPPPPPTSSTHMSGYDTYIKPPAHNTKPFVCNWVSDGKHCGNNFITSEELFQHLRTHTSLQQQQQNNCDATPPPQPQNACTIHGCPCGQRKSSPRPTLPGFSYGPNSVRYAPYSRPGHGYTVPSHNSFHY